MKKIDTKHFNLVILLDGIVWGQLLKNISLFKFKYLKKKYFKLTTVSVYKI